ncbi:hypothetical protein Tco_0358961 [Tanacetum coccineum]
MATFLFHFTKPPDLFDRSRSSLGLHGNDDRSSSLGYATNAKRARDDKAVSDKENAAVEPSLDNNTLTEIISEEELTCEAGKRLEVKQIKSPLLYHGFVYGETQFQEPPKVPLKRRQVNLKKHLEQAQLNHEGDVLRKVQERLSEEFEPLARNINLLLNSFEKILVKEMKDDLKYVLSLEDEFDEKCLILDIQTEFFKTQFESTISKSYSHVYENEMFEKNSSL